MHANFVFHIILISLQLYSNAKNSQLTQQTPCYEELTVFRFNHAMSQLL